MANDEVLGSRKTMFVLVIVVGCFAVLWPRLLSPLLLGNSKQHLEPNQFDREAGCCEVLFESEVAVLEIVNEVCSSAVGRDGKLSPIAAAECRKSVNETCGVDIAAFLKRSENVGKATRNVLETMKSSNSSCLKENFGVQVYNLGIRPSVQTWTFEDTVKQERASMRGVAPHPALRERGRAIPAGAPTPPSRGPVPLPPHARVRTSPLSVYFDLEIDVKPPPIPGMRPPLGSPGGPVTPPKSSMGFVMPIYTICIVVFFVYTLSKILFKRTGPSPYEPVSPDPHFQRRVFREESRPSPEPKLGHKERDAIVTAISGLVAEVHQQMEASYAQSQQRQDAQGNNTRPYTNGTVLNNTGPVHIIASEYREPSKDKSELETIKETTPPKDPIPQKESTPEKEITPEPKEQSPALKESTPETEEEIEVSDEEIVEPEPEIIETDKQDDLLKLSEKVDNNNKDEYGKVSDETEDFLNDARKGDKKSTPELLEEALKEDGSEEEIEEEIEEEEEEEDVVDDKEKSSVKVVGMETTAQAGAWLPPAPAPPSTRPAHESEDVKSIYLETGLPCRSQARLLVSEFTSERGGAPLHAPGKHEPVVSGKMTLSLIQDAPKDTPERELESTVDDFTTASGITQPAENQELSDEEEEIEEEIEIEEVDEELEEDEEPKTGNKHA